MKFKYWTTQNAILSYHLQQQGTHGMRCEYLIFIVWLAKYSWIFIGSIGSAVKSSVCVELRWEQWRWRVSCFWTEREPQLSQSQTSFQIWISTQNNICINLWHVQPMTVKLSQSSLLIGQQLMSSSDQHSHTWCCSVLYLPYLYFRYWTHRHS